MAEYPKITQQAIEDLTHILLQMASNSKYLEESNYSDKARSLLVQCFVKVRAEEGFMGNKDDEDYETSEITDPNDTWGIIRSIDISIRQTEKVARTADTDSARISAVKSLFDFNTRKIELLEKVVGMSKVSKIESLVKQFFRELPDEKMANRFLELLEKID